MLKKILKILPLKLINLFASTLLCMFVIAQADDSQNIPMVIQHSEAASYLHFLATGFDLPFTSKALKEAIEKSDEKGLFKNEQMKVAFNQVREYLENGYNFEPVVKNRPIGFYGFDALTSFAVASSSQADFENKLTPILPLQGVIAYSKLKDSMYPYFRSLMWDSTVSQHAANIDVINKSMDRSGFENLLAQAKAFYGSQYPNFLPLKVGLVPIPDRGLSRGHTSALNLLDVQVVPYLMTEGPVGNLDVIFHEFCHAFYETQSADLQKMADKFFLQSTNSHALFLYRYLNEALATAWGNGWYYEKLHGKLSGSNWYTVEYIDKLARGILPLIKDYTASKKSIDKNFLNKALTIAKKTFPNADRELDPNFISLTVFDLGNSKETNLAKQLRGKFRVQSLRTKNGLKKEEWEDIFNNTFSNIAIYTKHKNEDSQLLQDLLKLNLKDVKSNQVAILPRNGRYVFWFNAENKENLEVLVDNLTKKKILPKQDSNLSL